MLLCRSPHGGRSDQNRACMTSSLETRAKLACLYAGCVWGLFWIPLRALADAGLHDLWITTIYFLAPACLVLPILLLRWRNIWRGGWNLQLTVIASGAALTLYSASIIYTDVVRALMLFYLMPIWSILLARVVLGERITAIRIFAMGMALVGMLILFGLGVSFPVPRNVGDWMGLAGGICWAITMVRVRIHDQNCGWRDFGGTDGRRAVWQPGIDWCNPDRRRKPSGTTGVPARPATGRRTLYLKRFFLERLGAKRNVCNRFDLFAGFSVFCRADLVIWQ